MNSHIRLHIQCIKLINLALSIFFFLLVYVLQTLSFSRSCDFQSTLSLELYLFTHTHIYIYIQEIKKKTSLNLFEVFRIGMKIYL